MESDCPFKLALLQGSIQTPVPGLQKRGQWRRGHSVLCPLPTRTISPRNQPFVHCLRDSDSQVGFVPTGIHRNLRLQPVLNGTLLGDKKKKGGGGWEYCDDWTFSHYMIWRLNIYHSQKSPWTNICRVWGKPLPPVCHSAKMSYCWPEGAGLTQWGERCCNHCSFTVSGKDMTVK